MKKMLSMILALTLLASAVGIPAAAEEADDPAAGQPPVTADAAASAEEETEEKTEEEAPACDHFYGPYERVPSGCTEEGKVRRFCTLCGAEHVYSTTPPLGHNYEKSWDGDGYAYTCSRCGDRYTEALPTLTPTSEGSADRDPDAQALKSTNAHLQNYSVWSRPVTSYLYVRDDGNLTRVEYDSDSASVAVEVYEADGTLLNAKTLPCELPLFGGFYAGSAYNYLIFGQENPRESASLPVIRVVQYSRDFRRLGEVELSGINTTIPFDAGSLRCAELGKLLYVITSHQMNRSSDGLCHQANLMFSVDQEDLRITSKNYAVSNLSTGYVSHSFNQFITVDEGQVVTLNHGDAYPRGMALCRADADETVFSGIYGSVQGRTLMTFPGAAGANATGASAGALEASDSAYLAAVNTVDTASADVSYGRVRNVAVLAAPKDGFPSGTVRTIFLSDYPEGGTRSASTPQMVRFSEDRFLVLWEVQTKGTSSSGNQLAYVFVEGNGDPLGSVHTASGALSDCQPVLFGGSAVWYVTQNSAPVFCRVDADGAFTTIPADAGAEPEQPSVPETKPDETPKPETPKPAQGGTQTGADPKADTTQTGAGTQGSGSDQTKAVFTDVARSYWAADAIEQAVRKGVVNGYRDGSFRPGASMSTAHLCAMLARAFYSDELTGTSSSGSAWYAEFMDTLRAHGALAGTAAEEELLGRGAYAETPNQAASRYTMAQIMYGILRDRGAAMPTAAQKTAARSAIGDWDRIPAQYQEAVASCYALGVLKGGSNGCFNGASGMTRAQGCTIVVRLLDQLAG